MYSNQHFAKNMLDGESERYHQPHDDNVILMEHQKASVFRMLEIECATGKTHYEQSVMRAHYNSDCRFGILADKMGSGKTYTMLNLLKANKKCFFDDPAYSMLYMNHLMDRVAMTTLLIVPNKLNRQWAESMDKVGIKYFNINLMSRLSDITEIGEQDSRLDLDKLGEYDVILVNDTILSKDLRNHDMFISTVWNRVVVDEADSIVIPNRGIFSYGFMWLRCV